MSTEPAPYTICFPQGYDARAEFETPHRGYLGDVLVRVEGGLTFKLFFTDLARLQQTLEDHARTGRDYYAEPGLVVLPEVTTEAIREAVSGLWGDGFFRQLKSVS